MSTALERVQSPRELREGCQDLVERGAVAVIVTLGEKGAIAASAHGLWTVQTPPVPLVSSVGSGDSFLAGLMAALLQGQPLPQALTLAAACGAANAATEVAGQLHDGSRPATPGTVSGGLLPLVVRQKLTVFRAFV